MSTLFISDLHLDAERPDIIRAFIDFLNNKAVNSEALYILGDFVEYWVGDDDHHHPLQATFAAIKQLSQVTPVFLMRGNRDFLIGQQFSHAWNLTLIDDPYVIDLYGQQTLLTHGDLLCTDDLAYQAFRQQVRAQDWQQDFLNKPLEDRHNIVKGLRQQSQQAMQDKSAEIMDVAPVTVSQYVRQYNVQHMIHGHTHRPCIHQAEDHLRIVLGDWYDVGSYLEVDAKQATLYSNNHNEAISW